MFNKNYSKHAKNVFFYIYLEKKNVEKHKQNHVPYIPIYPNTHG